MDNSFDAQYLGSADFLIKHALEPESSNTQNSRLLLIAPMVPATHIVAGHSLLVSCNFGFFLLWLVVYKVLPRIASDNFLLLLRCQQNQLVCLYVYCLISQKCFRHQLNYFRYYLQSSVMERTLRLAHRLIYCFLLALLFRIFSSLPC